MGIPIFVGLLFFAIGIAVMFGSVVSFVKRRQHLANSVSKVGTVTAFATGMGRSGYLYFPLIQFKIPSGQTISFQSSFGNSRMAYAIGQQVEILYDARDPYKAEIDTLTSLWFVPGCMLVMGLGFATGGIFLSAVMILVVISQH